MKAEIEYYRQWVRLLWTAIIVLSGGLVGVFLSQLGALKVGLLVLGILILAGMLSALYVLDYEIRSLLRRINQ
ncbi:MAG: hypothetical protein QW733_07585 [Desulfurococcaceae archaeon]